MRSLCLVVADAARARVYSIVPADADDPRRGVSFIERADLVHLAGRRPAVEALANGHGLAHAPAGRGSGLDDHRRQHTCEVDHRFAVDIGTAVRAAVHATGTGRVVLIASAHMLGQLRPALGLDAGITVETHALDLTRLSTSQLHDQLADLGILPAPVRAVG